jgi:hypothetical protein
LPLKCGNQAKKWTLKSELWPEFDGRCLLRIVKAKKASYSDLP